MKIIVNGNGFNILADLPPDARARTETPRRSTPLPVSQTITPDTSNGWILALVGFLVVLLCIALAVIGWMAFLR
jgi:hypothetical protein